MPALTPNLTKTWEDIRNNPEHWSQKFSIIEFKDKNNKIYWNKDYTFIPHWKRYKEAKDWIKETKFPEYNCKIGWNANNEILLVSQNYFGSQRLKTEKEQELLNKIRKKLHQAINQGEYQETELKEALKLKTYEELYNFPYGHLYSEELAEWRKISQIPEISNTSYDLSRSDLVLLWKKQIYFITSFTYTNNYKLTVEIRARKCLLSLNYRDWIISPGAGIVNQAPKLIKDWTDKPKQDKKGRNLLDEQYRLHYDFCGDLGIKKIVQQSFASYQPKFQLFRAQVRYNGAKRNITWSEQVPTGRNAEPKQLRIPSDVKLSKFGEKEADEASKGWLKETALMTLIKLRAVVDSSGAFRQLGQMLLDAKMVLTIGPTEMTDLSKAFYSEMLEKEEELFTTNPTFTKWLKDQPHLWDHTTFQFYLFNKITMTANGRYLGIVEKDGKFILPYKLFINYSPGNLYYRWEFAFITVKCEISNEGSFEDWTNPARVMRGFNIKLGGKILASGASFGFGMNWADTGEEAGKIKSGDDPKAEQEAQTERMFKNTFRNFNDKSVEPAMFNANTIDFHYSLGEFFNRLTDPIFFYRCEISELLYNRLGWANNKSNQLNLPLSWKELGTWTQRPGLWKWSNVYLQGDINNFFTNLMNRGYWLDDGTELTNPKLAFAHAGSTIQIGGNAWNISSGEEELIEKREKVKEKLIDADITNADYSNKDYIGSQDANIWEELNRANNNVHTTSMGAGGNNCLGCLCGGGSHGNPNYSFSKTYNFTSGGTLELKTRGSGLKSCTIPAQGGTVKFEAHGNSATITLEYEKVSWETKIKKNPNDVKNEIDQDQLENEVEDEVEEEFEEEDENEMKEQLGKEREKEAEVEQEEEVEQEKEEEQETEQETEKEDEKETEQEKEKEKEQEKEQEEEQEEEEEGENEGEVEGEL